jgi:hypothetical protein
MHKCLKCTNIKFTILLMKHDSRNLEILKHLGTKTVFWCLWKKSIQNNLDKNAHLLKRRLNPPPKKLIELTHIYDLLICHMTVPAINTYLRHLISLSVNRGRKEILEREWGQFHQRSMCSFYVCKLRAQLFCAYVLGLYFTGARLLA